MIDWLIVKLLILVKVNFTPDLDQHFVISGSAHIHFHWTSSLGKFHDEHDFRKKTKSWSNQGMTNRQTVKQTCPPHRHSRSDNFGVRHFCSNKYVYEQLTNCPNFTWHLSEKIHFPNFVGAGRRGTGRGKCPLPRLLCLVCHATPALA